MFYKYDWLLQVAQHPDLPHVATQVGALLLQHADNETGVAWPGIDTLAMYAGCERRTIQRVISGMEKAGLLAVKRHPGRNKSNRYQPLLTPKKVTQKSPFKPEKVTNDALKGDTHVTRTPSRTTSERGRESSAALPALAGGRAEEVVTALASMWPHEVDGDEVHDLCAEALGRRSAEEIIERGRRYLAACQAGDYEARFIKRLKNWLATMPVKPPAKPPKGDKGTAGQGSPTSLIINMAAARGAR